MDNTKKKSTGKRIALIIVCVVLALILLLMIAGSIWVNSVLNRLNRPEDVTLPDEEIENILNETDPVEEDFTGEVVDPEDIQMPDAPADEIETADHIINILLIGQDRRENQGRQRSDAMILCTINTENKTLVMTSFLRDLYVPIPGHHNNRINAAYSEGGAALLDRTLRENFDLHIDGNIEVDFSQFSQIIDLLGGVQLELREDEAAEINKETGSGLSAGVQVLNGEQALTYARIRKLDADGDFSRTSRQRKLMNALLGSYRNIKWKDLLPLIDELLPLISTDMNYGRLVLLAMEILPKLSDAQITSQRIPADGTFTDEKIDGMAVLSADLEANRQLLRETLLN